MKTEKPRFVYRLRDHMGLVRYVGCSVVPNDRLFQLLREARMSVKSFGRTTSRLCIAGCWMLKLLEICPQLNWSGVPEITGEHLNEGKFNDS